MHITKIISIALDIQNTVNVYSDLETNIKNILVDRFEGRCFRACYISSINRIIKMSDCYINQDGVPSFGTINVIFEVTAIIYAIGEIINGCTVVNKDKRTIICSSEHASIYLVADDTMESVQKGQKLSVRVGGAKYNIGAAKVSVNAVPFLPVKVATIYRLPPVTTDTKLYLEPMLERIKEEETACEEARKANPKGWEFFSQLLYAYKEDQKKPQQAIEHNILDLISRLDKFPKDIRFISRDPRINLTKPLVYTYSTQDLPDGARLKESKLVAKEVILIMLDDYYNQLRTIREMLEIYGTQQALESHKNLWLIFKKSKV